MKKFVVVFLLSLFVSTTVYAASLNGEYKGMPIVRVLVNGSEAHPEVPAYIDGGSTMLPLRAVSESLGAKVEWNQETYSASVTMPKQQEAPRLSVDKLFDISANVGRIYVLDQSGNAISRGSGFLLQGGVFLTNCHLACKAASLKIDLGGKTYTTNTPLFKDEANDLYGVKIDSPGGLTYTTELPRVDSRVYTVGYPHGELRMTEGKVLSMGIDSGIDVIFHSAKTDSGQSGGVLVDSNGNVVGVTTGSSDDLSINTAIQMKYVQLQLTRQK